MIKTLLSIFTVLVFLVACNKTMPMPEAATKAINKPIRSVNGIITFENETYTVNDGVLNFETFEQYEHIVNNDNRGKLLDFANQVESAQLFQNYYATVSEEEKPQYEFIGKLLNKEGVIKIGAFLILIDFEHATVFAQKNGNASDLLASKNGVLKPGVVTFAIEDDVIEELKIYNTRGIFCKELWQEKFDIPAQDGPLPTYLYSVQQTPGGTVTFPVFINVSVKYWPAGIYFELNSRVVVTPAGNPLATAPFSYVTSYSCKRRCGASFSGANTRSFLNASNDKNIMYWNSRALRQNYTTITSTVTSSASVPPGASRTAHY